MNTAIFCFIFLACASICFSTPIFECRCLRCNKNVRLERVTGVKVLEPSPYCNKKEVIVTLENGNLRCLDPKLFTDAAVEVIRIYVSRKKINAGQIGTAVSSTEVPTSPY